MGFVQVHAGSSTQQPVELQADRARCGGGEGFRDTAPIGVAECEVTVQQHHRLIEVHDPVVPDVGVLMSLDDVVRLR